MKFFVVTFCVVCFGLTACGKKGDPVWRDADGRVVSAPQMPS